MKHAVKCNIKDFIKGSKEAFTEVFNLHHKRLWYFAQKLTGNAAEAEEIVSDAFLKLWYLRTQFETFQNIKAFLYITTRNACIDYLRNVRRVAGEMVDYNYTVPVEYDGSSFEREMIEAEVLQKIYEEIENLPDQCRKVIKMSYVDKLKNEEIADQLKLKVQTVKNHKHRALKAIRNALEALLRRKGGW